MLTDPANLSTTASQRIHEIRQDQKAEESAKLRSQEKTAESERMRQLKIKREKEFKRRNSERQSEQEKHDQDIYPDDDRPVLDVVV
ncbi:MAG: hypothetical protein SNJ70_00895 [Armatimonadota bacterium]